MNPEERPNQNTCSTFIKSITLEPVIFLSHLASALQGDTLQSLSIYKICHITYQYPKNICLNINNETIETQVQELEVKYSVYRKYIEWVPIFIMSLMLGALSDAHGRKVPMLLAKSGLIIGSLVILATAYFESWPAEILFVSSAIMGLTGGEMAFIIVALSYVAEKSSQQWRISRFAFLEVAKFLPFPLGVAFGGFSVRHWGFVPALSLAIGVRICAFIYLVLRVKSDVRDRATQERSFFQNFTPWKHFKEYATVCCKPRENHIRLWILLVLLANWTLSIPGMSEGGISMLFYRKKFHWQQDMYGYFIATGTALACLGGITVLPLLNSKTKLSEPAIEIIGNLGRVLCPLFVAFSTEVWMLWASLSLTFVYTFCYPAMKSFITKITSQDEYGKIFAVKSSSETLIQFFGGAMYSFLYAKTMDIFPSAYMLLSAAFSSISLFIFIFLLVDVRSHAMYSEVSLNSDEIQENTSEHLDDTGNEANLDETNQT